MNKKTNITALYIFCTLVFISNAYTQNLDDNLVLHIPGYKASNNPSCGSGPGIIARAEHFYYDHQDMTYRISYFNLAKRIGAIVQVTDHVGGDSDKWLLHEIESDFRNYYGLPGKSYVTRQINRQTIMAVAVGGWAYRWLSGSKVIHIEYTDLQMTKPEPIDIVKAYLAKHPSTLPIMTSSDLRTKTNMTEWIKDEMQRRLWLCEKWFQHHQVGKIDLSAALHEIVANITIFLNYREKYYNVNAEKDTKAISEYLSINDSTNIYNTLENYKMWWKAHKRQRIQVPSLL